MAEWDRTEVPTPPPPPEVVITLKMTEDEALALRNSIFRSYRAQGTGRGAGDDSWVEEQEGILNTWEHLYDVLYRATTNGRSGGGVLFR